MHESMPYMCFVTQLMQLISIKSLMLLSLDLLNNTGHKNAINLKPRPGRKFKKTNFISIYLHAHHWTLTVKTIQSAFQVMGVWPFNPGIVIKEKMAPSLETSIKGHMPLPQPSPVCEISVAIWQYRIEQMIVTHILQSLIAGPSQHLNPEQPNIPTRSWVTAQEMLQFLLLSISHHLFSHAHTSHSYDTAYHLLC